MDGTPLDWSAYRDKMVLVQFWHTESVQCRTELAAAELNYQRYHDRGFEVIGICTDPNRQTLEKLLQIEQFPWVTLHQRHPDARQPMGMYYGVMALPRAFLVGRDGKVALPGARASKLDKLLEELLGPPYVPKGKLGYIDLQPRANQKLAEKLEPTKRSNNLAELPIGEQTFGGVKFQIGDGLILLGSKRHYAAKPKKVEEITVNKTFTRLYILQGLQWGFGSDGTLIGEYRLHYEDGTEGTIPIVLGQDVRDWWDNDQSKPVSRGKVAWVGRNAASRKENRTLRLYLAAWENPWPDKKLLSIDLISPTTIQAGPFCVAMTLEEPTGLEEIKSGTTTNYILPATDAEQPLDPPYAPTGNPDEKTKDPAPYEATDKTDPEETNTPIADRTTANKLHEAASKGDLEKVRTLIAEGAALNAKNKKKETPLYLAIQSGNMDVARLLIEKGADVNVKGGRWWTPLHVAARFDHNDIADLLIAKGANVNVVGSGGWTPLLLAVRFGCTDIAKLLIDNDVDIYAETNLRMTPLLFAVLHYRKDIEKLLVTKGAQPDIFTESIRGDAERVKAFLEGEPNLVNVLRHQFTPLHWAAYCGHLNVAKLLIAKGADVNANSKYTGPLYWAVRKDYPDVVRFLIDKGADVNARDTYGATVLHHALTTAVAELLIDRGADVNAKDKNGWTPLHYISSKTGHKGVLKLLIPGDADISAEHPKALYVKAAEGQAAVAELLIAKGADVNAKDKTKRTPQDFAEIGGYEPVLEVLRKSRALIEAT